MFDSQHLTTVNRYLQEQSQELADNYNMLKLY